METGVFKYRDVPFILRLALTETEKAMGLRQVDSLEEDGCFLYHLNPPVIDMSETLFPLRLIFLDSEWRILRALDAPAKHPQPIHGPPNAVHCIELLLSEAMDYDIPIGEAFKPDAETADRLIGFLLKEVSNGAKET